MFPSHLTYSPDAPHYISSHIQSCCQNFLSALSVPDPTSPPCWFSGNRTHVVMWCIMGNVVIPPVHLTDLRVTCVVERPFKSFCRFLLILCASVCLIPPVFNVPTAGSPNHWVAPLLLYGLYEALHAGGLRLCADRNFLLEMEGIIQHFILKGYSNVFMYYSPVTSEAAYKVRPPSSRAWELCNDPLSSQNARLSLCDCSCGCDWRIRCNLGSVKDSYGDIHC